MHRFDCWCRLLGINPHTLQPQIIVLSIDHHGTSQDQGVMGNVWRTIFVIVRPAIVLSYHPSPNVLGINAANLQMLIQYTLNDHLIIVSVNASVPANRLEN